MKIFFKIQKSFMDPELVKILESSKKLKFILNKNIESFKIDSKSKSKNLNLLQKLILKSNHSKIKEYLKNNAQKYINNINYQNEKEWTALMMACVNSNDYSNNGIVKLLLENGADPNLKDKKGRTALSLVFSRSYKNIDIQNC
jgi:ankyrin repeat protein